MFKNIKLFKMLGVDVFLNVSWFLVFALFFTWTGTTVELFLTELGTVLILFGAILLHEFGHILAARSYGVSCDRVVLHILGGVAFINPKEAKSLTPKQNMWVYFAGPLVNLVIAGISFILFFIYTSFTDITSIDGFQLAMGTVLLLNLVIFIFNLLPIFPMDGGGILRNFMQHLKVKNAVVVSAVISMIFCLALLTFSIMFASIGGGIISVLFFFYALAEIRKERNGDDEIKFGGITIKEE